MRNVFDSITELIFMEDEIQKADVILIPGSSRKELIIKAIELYKDNYAKYILPSGGFNKKLHSNQTEYEFLKEEAIRNGVPEVAILKEDKASNTFENAKFSLEVCRENGININKVILVCKNYHARRAYITYKLFFPKETEIIVQPVIDSEQVKKESWMYNSYKRNIVLNEVAKIGEYFKEYNL